MADAPIIDALYGIPKNTAVTQLSECLPFMQDLRGPMRAVGISGVVLVQRHCGYCPYHWSCADRRTREVSVLARQNSAVRGLASYDSLRIGESLRWIHEAIAGGGLSGCYLQAECLVSGLDTARMYPLYGLCAMLRAPLVLDFSSRENWLRHLPEIETMAADFPELEIVLTPPQDTEAPNILRLALRFPRISFILCPEEMDANAALREFVELQGRERVLFCSSLNGWPESVQVARKLEVMPAAAEAYLYGNAARLFSFPAVVDAASERLA
jgi:predicted TIM-barrel fold metal-dependent hydrolase